MLKFVIFATVALTSLSGVAKGKLCKLVSTKDIALRYLQFEFNGWRDTHPLTKNCHGKVSHLDLFQGWEGKAPKVFLVRPSSMKITDVKMLDLQMQRYAFYFSVENEEGKTLEDHIIFEKKEVGRLAKNSHCARLLFAPSNGVYLDKSCRPNKK